MTTEPQDHSRGAGPDRAATSRPRRAGHAENDASPSPQLRAEVRQAAAAMIDLGVGRGRPRRDLVAEHLALGGRLPGHPLRGRRRRPAEHPLHRQRGRRHPGPHRGTAADRHGRVPRRRPDRRARPATRCPRCATSCGSRSTSRRRHAGTSSWRAATDLACRRRPRRGGTRPTTSPTSCSPPAPPGAARACCARTGSRWTRRRHGRPAARSPAPTATSASTRSSTTSATRPASWPACRPAPR